MLVVHVLYLGVYYFGFYFIWIELAQLAVYELKGTNWLMNNVQTNVLVEFRDLPVFPTLTSYKPAFHSLTVALTYV